MGKLLYRLRGRDRFLAWNRLAACPGQLIVSSPGFADGAMMAKRYAGEGVGANFSPPLAISNIPAAAAGLTIILQDPDAPLPRPVVHLIAHLPAGTTFIAEGGLNQSAAIAFGRGTFGRTGYHGPRPVKGHGPHRYIFQVFALAVPVTSGGSLKTQLAVMEGNILARGRLTGMFERR
jgi:Raf kinase inhibitor-like protein, YbhB/YbcL family